MIVLNTYNYRWFLNSKVMSLAANICIIFGFGSMSKLASILTASLIFA
jgi:hypothetical protein